MKRSRRFAVAGLVLTGSFAAITPGGETRAFAAGGGVGAPAQPVADDVRCLSGCLAKRRVAEGGSAKVTGRNLGHVREIRMGGVAIERIRARAGSVRFEVPRKAASAKPLLLDDHGGRSRVPVRLVVEPADSVDGADGFRVRQVEAVNRKSFFKGKKQSALEYMFEAEGPTDVRIDVLKGKRQKVVDSLVQRDRQPYEVQRARWRGLTKKRKVAKNGKYRFRVSELGGAAAAADRFRFYNHMFPLKGQHSYGQGLGAGRGHQGQDILGGCGKKVVAARGGRVTTRSYQGAAGYYIVIDGAKTGVDYAYMHLKRAGRPKVGERVKTGEVIGRASDTGNATTCMLHFELWSAPGWYEGGRPMDLTPLLRRWDRWS